MTPIISSEVLRGLLDAAAASTTEICGLLRGDGGRIVRADPAANVAADPSTRFEIDPAVLIAAYRDARRPGAAGIAGCYHSHPGGSPDPSPTDAAQAAPDGMLWLILGHARARLWRAVPRGAVHGRFDPAGFGVEHTAGVEKIWHGVHMDAAGRLLPDLPARDIAR